MITTKQVLKEARFLAKGDKLSASGAVVTHAPYSDGNTPKGKICIGIQYPSETTGSMRIWNKYTKIGVITE